MVRLRYLAVAGGRRMTRELQRAVVDAAGHGAAGADSGAGEAEAREGGQAGNHVRTPRQALGGSMARRASDVGGGRESARGEASASPSRKS